jgi:hypothetical protein
MGKKYLVTIDTLSDGWCGHNEVVPPTLLHHNGFTITDIGDKGRFTPPGLNDSFYSESESNSNDALDCENMSWPREKQDFSD